VLTLERRLEILSWARRNNSYVIEDEHDSEFRFEGEPVLPLIALDGIKRVIFFGTFHMTMFPSMSLAYLILPQDLVPIYTRSRQLCSEQIPTIWQCALAEFIQTGGLKRHLRKMRQLYNDRRQSLLAALESNFKERATVFGDNAGLHLTVRFTTKLSTRTISERAAQAGIGLVSSADYYFSDPPNAEFLLGYGNLSEKEISQGVGKLREIIR
jgi:GntR family transcriptional regulator / MocR family aminotransferase